MHCILKWLNSQPVQQHCPMCPIAHACPTHSPFQHKFRCNF
ncbi:anaphase promoting complex subunit 11 [Columba livia]|uniref:Anaphase promoting complex subunit 11 n=1 Tax=Columba livia TaxID=8932 RepID=A0A2I0LMR3_COLLI|nr:anaphase promoting complex subunit 11 [Columba livia]